MPNRARTANAFPMRSFTSTPRAVDDPVALYVHAYEPEGLPDGRWAQVRGLVVDQVLRLNVGLETMRRCIRALAHLASWCLDQHVPIGETSGFARRNGSWAHHGEVKRYWVYPLHRRATSVLAAPFDHPALLSVWDNERTCVVDLTHVVIDGAGGLYERPCEVADHRNGRLHVRRSPQSGLLVAPSLSTIKRVLWAVERDQLDAVVHGVVARRLRLCGQSRSTARACVVRSKTDGRPVHLLAALTRTERVVVAQAEVDHKENEIIAFRPMLELLDLADCLVTADALHTQREHARFLVEEKSADYLFFVKENQPTLYDAIAGLGDERWSKPVTETGKGHGRLETRTIWVADAAGIHDFPHLSQVIRIMREVDAKTKTARSTETAYAVTSLPRAKANRRQLLTASRGHWSIENGLHSVRDATMREDRSKVRSGSAPRALATMRNLVISVLRLAGATNIAQALRSLSRRPASVLTMLGL